MRSLLFGDASIACHCVTWMDEQELFSGAVCAAAMMLTMHPLFLWHRSFLPGPPCRDCSIFPTAGKALTAPAIAVSSAATAPSRRALRYLTLVDLYASGRASKGGHWPQVVT